MIGYNQLINENTGGFVNGKKQVRVEMGRLCYRPVGWVDPASTGIQFFNKITIS